MIDPVNAALASLATHSPSAFGLLFLAGALTSAGPCVAPRYIAVAALASGERRPSLALAAFAAGLISAYVALGFAGGMLGRLWSLSGSIDLVLAIGLITGGSWSLMRAVPHGAGACGTTPHAPAAPRSLGATFLLGASSVFVISPCCTPVVAAIAGASTAIGQPVTGVLLLVCFGCGHALPLVFAGQASAFVERFMPRGAARQATAIVSAVLMLALGAYYGALA